jgi:hypothetical protein
VEEGEKKKVFSEWKIHDENLAWVERKRRTKSLPKAEN